MSEFICNHCSTYINGDETHCPQCGAAFIFSGDEKNITDSLEPNCLVYRYDGSDLLETAVIVKQGKVNVKAATRLKELAKPVTIAKNRIYAYNPDIWAAINDLRAQRKTAMQEYDALISKQWEKLTPYSF